MPFEEIPHTADRSLRVWSASLPQLFSEAAQGMNTLMGMRLASGPRTNRSLHITGLDPETLLVNFLSELLFISEQDKLAFDEFKLEMTGDRLEAEMSGALVLSIEKIIKAVTFHNLHIRQTPQGYEVEIVFDV